MKKGTKKGFTLVELVIVIAVIAVLSAIIIPVTGSIVSNAKETVDKTTVKALNTALAQDEAKNGARTLYSDVIDAMAEYGYGVDKLTPLSLGDILWDSQSNTFVLYKDGKEVMREKGSSSVAKVNLWRVAKNNADLSTEYSNYLADNFDNKTVSVKTGVDVGNNKVEVEYIRTTGNAQSVIFNTNGGGLTVDAPNDNVNHYGSASYVNIAAVANNSYHEFGMADEIKLKKGRTVIEKSGKVGSVMVTATTVGDIEIVNNDGTIGGVAANDSDVATALKSKVTGVDESKVLTYDVDNSKFAAGLGTEEAPYLISTAEQFKNINYFAKQMETEGLAFKLINDIDLSKINVGSFVSYAFNGILDGANYTLTLNPSQKYLFGYSVDNVTVKNLNYVLNGTIAAPLFNKYGTKAASYDSSSKKYTVANEKITLLVDNVKISGLQNIYYEFTNRNFGLITSCQGDIQLFDAVAVGGSTLQDLSGENKSYYANSPEITNCTTYTTIKNCDVTANLMGKEYNAVYLGGQIYGNEVNIENCSYSGVFVGEKVGIALANYSSCENFLDKIKLNNVVLNGSLIYNTSGALTFANNKTELGTVKNNGTISQLANDSTMELTVAGNKQYVLSAANNANVSNYSAYIKLSPVKLTDANYTQDFGEISIFGIRINCMPGNLDIYKAKNLSRKQAEEKGIVLNDSWNTSLEGYKYQFIQSNGQWFIVIDFEVNGLYYEFKNQDELISAKVYAYSEDGRLLHISKLA